MELLQNGEVIQADYVNFCYKCVGMYACFHTDKSFLVNADTHIQGTVAPFEQISNKTFKLQSLKDGVNPNPRK